jgi:hypothetical protein
MPPRGGWSDLQIAYMRWLCLPNDKDMGGHGRGLRDPATATEFALKYGVTIADLYNWQRIQGWDQALAVVAEKTFKSLKPLFLKNLAVSLLKPDPNDRLFTAAVRYVEPIIDDHERDKIWERDLPQNTGNVQSFDALHAERLYKFRALPAEQRELILDLAREMLGPNQENSDNLAPFYSVMKPYADDEPAQAEDQLPALPAPAATPADTTPIQSDTTPAPAGPPIVPKEFYTSKKPKLKRASPPFTRDKQP